MGKIKKSKSKVGNDPTGSSSKHEEEDDLSINEKSTSENVVQTVLDQLQGPSVEEKFSGLQTLAMFILNSKNVEAVIRYNAIKVVAPLLLDSASMVRNAAAGVLRNFSTLGQEACDTIIEHDVMTPLIAYFHKYAESLPPKSTTGNKKDDSCDTFVQNVNLLWNLCENSELALKYLNESKVINILVKYLDVDTFGEDIVIALLQCFFVVTEDNGEAIQDIKKNCEEIIMKLFLIQSNDPSMLLIKTLAAGVVINASRGRIVDLPPESIATIMSILATTLSLDHRLACHQLCSSMPSNDVRQKVDQLKSKEGHKFQKQLRSVSHLLEAQQNSVEIVANLCSNDDSDDNSMDVDEGDLSDGDDVSSNDGSGGNEFLSPTDRLPPEIIEAMGSYSIFEKVWARTQLPAANIMMLLKESDEVQNLPPKFCNLQSRALLCVSNMLTTLPVEAFGTADDIYNIYLNAGKYICSSTGQEGVKQINEFLESSSAVMRAALDRLKVGCHLVSIDKLVQSQSSIPIEILFKIIRECDVAEIRCNLYQTIGSLGFILTHHTADRSSAEMATDAISRITELLLDHAHKEAEVWVLAEVLDTIMDLYSDDNTDQLAANIKLIERLIALQPILKNKVRQQKKWLGDHHAIVNTASTNLPRFIKYKKNRISKL